MLWSTFGGGPTLAPGLTTLGLGCTALALDSVGRLPPPLQSVWAGLSAYMATGMFILQPVAQLVRNFQVRCARCAASWPFQLATALIHASHHKPLWLRG